MLTFSKLREILWYDFETGKFKRRVTIGKARAESTADILGKRGYYYINIDGKRYYSHRLVWFYVTGEWPAGQIDHINLNKTDNRIINLREATHQQNQYNVSLQRNNTSGFKGVNFNNVKRKWMARIAKNGKRVHLGYFDCKAAACLAYIVAADKFHGEFARV